MSLSNRISIAILSLSLVSGCFGGEGSSDVKFTQKGTIYKSDKDAPIPNKLIEILEEQYVTAYRLENPDSPLTDLQLTLQVPRRLLQISVQLIEKNAGTLTGNTEFRLPLGGAAIDLAEYIAGEKGVFYTRLLLEGLEEEQMENVKVYFVSNSKKMSVQEDIYGAGCGKFFDISKFYHNVVSQQGHEVAAANLRYIGQMIGTFFFFYAESDAFYVGSTSFIDSRYQDAHCIFPDSR